MKDYYKLDEQHRPIPVTMLDYFDWQRSLPEDIRTGIGRKVAKSTFGHVVVSTVFLGSDHGFGIGAPMLYETMIFGGDRDEETHRYATWGDATKGHERISAEIAKQIEKQTKNPIEA